MDPTLWLLCCGIGTLLIRVGSALHCSGMSRSKNSSGAVMRLVVDLALVSLSFWLIGAALMGSGGHFINWKLIASLRGAVQPAQPFFLLTAILISSGIVVGAVGERSKFFPACAASIALAGVVVPLAARWTLAGGWLARLGFVDFAGAAAIHLTGAAAGLVFVYFLGARMGKYNNDGSSNAIPGHNVPLASVGVLVLFVGWIPYLLGFAGPGPRAGSVAMNVVLAGSAGAVASLVFGHFRYYKPDVHFTYSGLMAGMVAISAAGNTDSTLWAAVIGAAAGLLIPSAIIVVDMIWKFDDVTGAIAVHGVGAIIGLALAPFAAALSWGGRFAALGMQVLGVAVVLALVAAVFVPLLWILRGAFGLRSREADEFDGLDLAEHDIGAYPDFQQNMIKSYHLREA
ncbi:MAG: ammonium transporter [Tepidisphaerales bacterium]